MKTFVFWLILLILLMGYGLSTKYKLILDGKQLTITRLDYWGLKGSDIYKGYGFERFEFSEGPFPVMVKGKARYYLKLYDPSGALIPLPRALGEVYGSQKVKALTNKINMGIQQGHFIRTGYAHKMIIALGVFPLIFTILYGGAYVSDRKRKGNPKDKFKTQQGGPAYPPQGVGSADP